MVADAVKAPIYFDRGMLTCNYYSYWSGVQHEGVELYPREGRTIVVDKTNDGLSMICIVFPKEEFDRIRSNIEGEYLRTIQENAPTLFERLRTAKREERFAGTGFLPNFFRRPFGHGWALVGDAGYVKDPILAQGITNSFSHAQMLAEALDEAFLGLREMEDALADYEHKRNDEVLAMFEHNTQLAMLEPPPPEMVALLNALQGNSFEIGRFLGTVAGTVSLAEFFSPENIGRIMERAALKSAA